MPSPSRRHALKLGASGFMAGLSLPTLFQLQATASNGKEPKAKA